MTLAGHSSAHFPQPTHLSEFTRAVMPRITSIALRGHTFAQQPHATQSSSVTIAFRFFFTVFFISHLTGFYGSIIA